MQRLHTHANYIYGVIVGLAIREALVRTVPQLIPPFSLELWKVYLVVFRLILFLLTITCFYFGAGIYFDKVHLNPETAVKYPRKSYGLDFASGLIHFLIFFAWSLTVVDFSRHAAGVSPFLFLLSAVFLYDLVWIFANVRFDSVQEIKMWTLMCLFVFVVATAVFFVSRTITQNDVFSEELALVVYLAYLAGDAVELLTGQPVFLPLIKTKILPRSD